MKHLFVIQKLRLIGSISTGFAQNTIYDFQNTVLNSVALSSTNATKTCHVRRLSYKSFFEAFALNFPIRQAVDHIIYC